MKCSKCGKELAPDEKFCGSCGTIVSGTVEETASEPEKVTETAPATQQATTTDQTDVPGAATPGGNDQPAVNNDHVPENGAGGSQPFSYIPTDNGGEKFSYTPPREPEKAPAAPVKKKRIGGLIAVLVAAVVLIAIAVVAVFAKESIIRLFMSPEDYTKHVLKNNLTGNKELAEIYDASRPGKGLTQSSIRYFMNASDEALDDFHDILEAEGEDIDRDELDFASEIAWGLDTTVDNGKVQLATDLTLGGKTAITADMIYDTDGDGIYIRSKELNEDYAFYEFQGGRNNYTEQEIRDMLSMLTFSYEGMPSGKDMSELWDKYAVIAIDQIDEVEESREKMEAGDVSEKLTVLEITIDDKLSKSIAVEILGELKDDDEFKDLLKEYAKAYEPAMFTSVYGYRSSYDMDDILDDVDDWLDDAYKEAKNIKFKDKATLEIYVSNRGKIQGVRLATKDSEFYSLYTKKGSKFGSEIKIVEDDDELMKIVGNGKVSFGKVVGSFDFEFPEEDVKFTLGVEGFNISQMAAGNLSGTITLDLGQFSKELKELDKEEDANGAIRKLADYEARLYIASGSKTSEVKFSLNNDKQEYVSAGYTVSLGSGGSVKLPSGKESVQIEDEDDLIEYFRDCDFDGWADDLEDCGVPEDVTDAVGEISDLLEYYY